MSNIVVVSRDTDATVYLLSYFKEFAELGLKKLWIAAGIGDKRRYIPIHHLFTTFGETFCKILLKCHFGCGCAYISKIGAKALNADPVTYLNSFGEYPMLDEHQIRDAEKYLVKVFDNKSDAENFDKLRYLTHRKTNSVFELPPTSYYVTNGHIPRWWFLYKQCSNLLSGENIDYLKTTDYGWDVVGEELVPNKNVNFLPDELSLICKCKNVTMAAYLDKSMY